MDKDESIENEDYLFEETTRQIQEQIETNREAKRQGAKILRIVATLIGVGIAAISAISSIILSEQIPTEEVFPELDYDRMATSISLLNDSQYEYIYGIAVIGVLYYIWRASTNGWISVSGALDAMSPTRIKTGVQLSELQKFEDMKRSKRNKEIISENIRIIEENKKDINSTQNAWEGGHSSLVISLYSIFMLVILSILLLTGQASLVLLSMGLIVVAHLYWIHRYIGSERLTKLATQTPKAEICKYLSVLALTIMFKLPDGGIMLAASAIILILTLVSSREFWTNMNGNSIMNYVFKEITITVYSLVIGAFLFVGSPNLFPDQGIPALLFISIFILSFFYALIAALIGAWNGMYDLTERYGLLISVVWILMAFLIAINGYAVGGILGGLMMLAGVATVIFLIWSTYNLYQKDIEIGWLTIELPTEE
ncbi:hypothetical protein [Haloarcula brevis]|uniref:hypothetical protein n=1 Tax=Haloarcula brevis TaxID=3111453 RepID=UPI00300F076B